MHTLLSQTHLTTQLHQWSPPPRCANPPVAPRTLHSRSKALCRRGSRPPGSASGGAPQQLPTPRPVTPTPKAPIPNPAAVAPTHVPPTSLPAPPPPRPCVGPAASTNPSSPNRDNPSSPSRRPAHCLRMPPQPLPAHYIRYPPDPQWIQVHLGPLVLPLLGVFHPRK